jgi:hypothetical protein
VLRGMKEDSVAATKVELFERIRRDSWREGLSVWARAWAGSLAPAAGWRQGCAGRMRPRPAYDSLGSAYEPCRGGPAGA